jgi:hypothetical protein
MPRMAKQIYKGDKMKKQCNKCSIELKKKDYTFIEFIGTNKELCKPCLKVYLGQGWEEIYYGVRNLCRKR